MTLTSLFLEVQSPNNVSYTILWKSERHVEQQLGAPILTREMNDDILYSCLGSGFEKFWPSR